jgi:cytochrome c biogenesis protein CcmG, thiol:disulfide interchange protein DsbE
VGCGPSRPEVKVGEPAPAIAGTTLDGGPFDLASLRGRPVILNFWYSTCEPCRREFPLLKQEVEAKAGDGLAVVGVLFNTNVEGARSFVDEMGATWPTVQDPDKAARESYLVVAAPQSYFIDRDGVVQALHIGEILEEDFDALYPKIAS